jgi:predicted CXXCH cytochrome family protein
MKLFVPISSLLVMITMISCADYSTVRGKHPAELPFEKAGTCVTSKCHAAIGEGKYVHGPVAVGECQICHGKSQKHREMPYRYKFGKTGNISSACIFCHTSFESGEITVKHEKYEECIACHTHHGSSNMYQLSSEGSKLCFQCHEQAIATHQETTRITRFRNGNMNLHFEHIEKSVMERTCLSCHETHAGSFPGQSVGTSHYGKLRSLVAYKKTETGGSCITGCHKEKSYNRIDKVENID